MRAAISFMSVFISVAGLLVGMLSSVGCAQRVTPGAPGDGSSAPLGRSEAAPADAERLGKAAVLEAAPAHAGRGWREVFPHVRFDAATKTVEFDGEVPIDCHNPKTPRVYLEVTACARNSKEHESLVVTDAKPSHVHAALLLAGLEQGVPGRWVIENGRTLKVAPSGALVEVSLGWRDSAGLERTALATDWVVSTKGSRLSGAFVFAGSRIVSWQGREYYDADGTGLMIGLTTFSSETIAYSELLSPESAIEEPEWIADAARVPAMGTEVVVRVRAAAGRR